MNRERVRAHRFATKLKEWPFMEELAVKERLAYRKETLKDGEFV